MRFPLAILAVSAACAAACASSAKSSAASATSDTTAADSATAADGTASAETAIAVDTAAAAETAAPATLPYAATPYAGECPNFDAGPVSMDVAGFPRSVLVTLPPEPNGAGVLFLWHGLGDSAKNFSTGFGAAQIAKMLNVIVIAPDVCCNTKGAQGCCSQMTGWHFVSTPEQDSGIFDGALACLTTQYNVDRKRVFTMGFSAGALWSTWLVMHRSEQLAAAAVLSGGVNDFNPWVKPNVKTPVMDSSGGVTDTFGGGLVDFQASIAEFNKQLRAAGHFVAHCQHQEGHTVTPEIATFAVQFLNAHTFAADGKSPMASGLPANAPAGCKIVP